jgi:hypothetical protein
MAEPAKDTIYIDIDDEITGIIDKVRSSNGKIVALVLPKRASVFQSIVNMKLLKRASEDAKKHLVLITSESGLMPLAGAAGVHVAKTLTSKPEIPSEPVAAPNNDDEVAEVEDDEEPDEVTSENSGDKPVGELAGLGAAATAGKNGDLDTVELDNTDEDVTDKKTPLAAAGAAAAAKKASKDKKLAIPNFERFRKLIIFGGVALVALIIGLIYAAIVMPKATIAIDTDASAINVDENLKLSTTAKSVKLSDNTLPAKYVTQQKTATQQVGTTGQKNTGNKASGNVSITNCSDFPASLPAGTGFSTDGKTYISTEAGVIPPSSFKRSGACNEDGKATVNAIAQSGGSNYNIAAGATMTIAGKPADLSARSGKMDGGTDRIVQVVSQSDIANARSKITANNDNSVKKALQDQLKGDNYYAIMATFAGSTPNTSNSAEVGDEASTVTVTQTITYSMFGVKEDDLKKVVENALKEQIDTDKQSILSLGLDKAVFNVNQASETAAELSMSTTATAGPELDIATIKREAAGKKSGQVKSDLQSNPDVTGVEVKLSPFWVTSVPKKESKITVTIEKPTPATDDAGSE